LVSYILQVGLVGLEEVIFNRQRKLINQMKMKLLLVESLIELFYIFNKNFVKLFEHLILKINCFNVEWILLKINQINLFSIKI
jgi:hypothetical protein